MAFSKARRLANLMSADSNEIPAGRRTLGIDSITKAMINDNVIDIARLDVSDGSNGQFLRTNGAGTLSFGTVSTASSPYNDWAIKTADYTLSNKDQIIVNKTSASTMTLPAGSAGSTVIIKATGGGTVTIGRNGSQKINSAASDATLMSGNGVQLVYVDDTIGWLEI